MKSWIWDENNDIGKYFLTFFFYGINLCIFYVYCPLFLPKIGMESLLGMSYFIVVSAIFMILGQNFWGWLCLKKERFYLFPSIGFLGFSILWAFLLWGDPQGIYLILAVQGFLIGAVVPCAQTLVTLVHPENKGTVLGRLYAWESVGWGFSSLGFGLYFRFSGEEKEVYERLFLGILGIDVLLFFLFFFLISRNVKGLDWGNITSYGYDGYRRVFQNRSILSLLFFMFLVASGSSCFFFYFSRYFTEIIGGTSAQIGISLATTAALGAFVYPKLGRWVDVRGPQKALMVSWAVYMILFFILWLVDSSWLVVILYAIPVYPLLTVSANAAISGFTLERDRAIAFGIMDTSAHLSSVLAPLAGGFWFHNFSLDSLPILSIGLIFPAILFFRGVKSW